MRRAALSLRPLAALQILAALLLASTLPAAAQPVAREWVEPGAVELEPLVEHGGLVLTLSGPDGFHRRTELVAGQTPRISAVDAGGVLPDGFYTWELRVVPVDVRPRSARDGGGEAAGGSAKPDPQVQTGSFAVVGGAIVAGGETEPGAGERSDSLLATKATVLTNADGVIRSSLCVGFDCSSSETFGFDTVRLKENNTRLHFDDTSSAGAFPTNNWQIRANSRLNGGANFLGIVDLGPFGSSLGGELVFAVEAGAPANALYVEDAGRVGFGTATPAVELHAVDGDTPTLRLEQDGSANFSPQTWDVAGNEVGFFVRDVTGGSHLPFRIRPGAPSSSIDVAGSGNVGIGTGTPTARLDVAGSLAVSGTVDGRDVSADGATLDAHVADFDNPHQVPIGKAGTVDGSAFGGGTAQVTFAQPFATADYGVVLTPVTGDPADLFVANVTGKTATGFGIVVSAAGPGGGAGGGPGGGPPSALASLVEVGWVARPPAP